MAEEAPSISRSESRSISEPPAGASGAPEAPEEAPEEPGLEERTALRTEEAEDDGALPASLPPPLSPDDPADLDPNVPSYAGASHLAPPPVAFEPVRQRTGRRKKRDERFAAGELVAGKYRLEHRIARGGMSEVWACTHEELRAKRAIKFLDQGKDEDPEHTGLVLERFRFEAQLSAKLGQKTRHVVAVYDAGAHRGVPYLVMEFVEGKTLEKEFEGDLGVLSPERLADVFDQVSDALAVAHGLGVVHRDLKPSNLLIGEEGEGTLFVKVADFGVAKATRKDLAIEQPKVTLAGFLVGSPGYMSPEQLRGDAAIDGRSDVWSLGVVAYEALTGWPPFSGKSIADLIVAISTKPFEPPSRLRPGLPPAIDGFFGRALAKEPGDRFASVAEMAAALRAVIEAPPRRRLLPAARPLAFAAAACALALGAGAWMTAPSRPGAPAARSLPAGAAGPAGAFEAPGPLPVPQIRPATLERTPAPPSATSLAPLALDASPSSSVAAPLAPSAAPSATSPEPKPSPRPGRPSPGRVPAAKEAGKTPGFDPSEIQ